MRRVRLTSAEYDDLLRSKRWCELKGFTSFVTFYDELLTYHAKRRALPPEAYRQEEEPSR